MPTPGQSMSSGMWESVVHARLRVQAWSISRGLDYVPGTQYCIPFFGFVCLEVYQPGALYTVVRLEREIHVFCNMRNNVHLLSLCVGL